MNFIKKLEITGHAGAIYSCDATEEHIYSASADKFIVRWFIKDGKQDKFAVKFDHSVYIVRLIENELLAVGLSNGDLHFIDLKTNKEVKFYKQHIKSIFSIHYNSIKNQIYVGDADGNLSVWDSKSLDLIIYLPLDCGKIRSISASTDGDIFALACQDGLIRVFENSFFNETHSMTAHKGGVTSILFHPIDKERLISGGKDALMKIWDYKNEKEIVQVVAHTFAVYDLLAVNNGKTIVSASLDKNIKTWDSKALTFIKRLDFKVGGHKHSVNALAKINEQSFVSCSDDKKLIVWSTNEDV